MTCRQIGNAIVCGSPPGIVRRAVQQCPTCERRRRMVIRWDGAWYGSTVTCCTCGDSWSDGERLGRPFARGWRQEATRRAREKWRNALSPQAYADAVRADVRWALGEDDDEAS